MANKRILEIRCPECQATLTVDADTGEVTGHKKQKPMVDLTQAVQALKQGGQRRKELFEKSMNAEKHKGERLKEKFDEAMKQAKENPDAPPPLREIDLD